MLVFVSDAVSVLPNMVKTLLIMLCCTAQEMFQLCSMNVPIMLNYAQNLFPHYRMVVD